MTAQKPLMLKDFLEMDSNSESCPPNATTLCCLLEKERGSHNGVAREPRMRSKKAMTKISAVMNALKLLPTASPSRARTESGGFLTRSLSKKLKRSFWKRRGEEEEKETQKRMVKVRDIVRFGSFIERSSFEFPSPVVSSCSSWSNTDSCSGSDFVGSSAGSSECGESKKNSPPGTPSPNPSVNNGVSVENSPSTEGTATSQRASKEVENEGSACPGCQSEEQLSPVSVMEFPYQGEDEEEEEEAISASFQHSLASIERTTYQLLQKIRRFESLAELDPVDLLRSFASTDELPESTDHVGSKEEEEEEENEEEEEVERRARELLKKHKTGSWEQDFERLLLDLFIEGLSCNQSINQRSLRCRLRHPVDEEQLLVKAANDWMSGHYCRAEEDKNGEVCLKEMERNGQWRCFEEEEEEVPVAVEAGVLGSLLEELVLDLVSS